jgi:hypothetical protein
VERTSYVNMAFAHIWICPTWSSEWNRQHLICPIIVPLMKRYVPLWLLTRDRAKGPAR